MPEVLNSGKQKTQDPPLITTVICSVGTR
jgi:hypothetical protein